MTAATTLSLMSIFSLIGSLAFASLSLKLNIRYLASAFFLFQVIAILILLTTRNLALIYLYTAFMGLSIGALFAAMPTFVGAYYPRERYAQVIGVIIPFFVLAQAGSATAFGVIYDITNKYTLAFYMLGVFALVGLICAFWTRPPGNNVREGSRYLKS